MITSFSEKMLLSSFYQNYLNPPDCEKQIVEDPCDSLFDTLNGLNYNPYEGKIKADYLHKGLEPVRAIARMVFMVAVGVVIAPLGVLWHTANALGRFNGKHAYCAYSDFSVSLQTLFVSVMTATMAWGVFDTRSFVETRYPKAPVLAVEAVRVFFLALGIFMPLWRLGGFNIQKFIPEIIGHSENRVAMCISLRLRNDLGLVGPDGSLLPFASQDNICHGFNGKFVDNKGGASRAVEKLCDLIGGAEIELAHYVGAANKLIPATHRVKYHHPFNGEEVASRFAKAPATEGLDRLIAEMRLIARKIELMRNILQDSLELAVNGGYGQQIMESRSIWNYNHKKAYSAQHWHLKSFNQEWQPPQVNQPKTDWSTILNNIDIDLLENDPRKSAEYKSASPFDKFKTQIQYAKWCVVNHVKVPEMHELIGLKKDYTQDALNKQYRYYALQLFPDKVEESKRAIATTLFACLNSINTLLKK